MIHINIKSTGQIFLYGDSDKEFELFVCIVYKNKHYYFGSLCNYKERLKKTLKYLLKGINESK
jgi:hypothetical protein